MKKYLKIGLGTIIPITLVAWVLNLLYGMVDNLMTLVLPSSLGYQWWFVFPFIVGVIIALLLIGFIFSHFKVAKWSKKQFEKLVNKVPLIGSIYEFGLEIVDSFITDAKENGEKLVVEIIQGGQKRIGLLSNEEMKIVFIPSWPNPMNGNGFKVDEYKVICKMKVKDFFKLVGSLGSIGGDLWETKIEEKKEK